MMNRRCLLPSALALTVLGLSGAAAAPEDAPPVATGFTPKLTAPIGISYKLEAEPRVGEALAFTLTITADAGLSEAVVELVADDGLTLIEPVAAVVISALGIGESSAVEVSVIPLVGGTQYLHVSVTGAIRGEPQTRSISVPIRTPDSARKPDDATTGKPGETVRSLEAIETVR